MTEISSYIVRVGPEEIVLHCRPDETLIACAWRSGYYWPTICGGLGECGACRCEVVGGQPNVMPPDEAEALFFRLNPNLASKDRPIRLACRMMVTGPVEILKKGVRPR